MPVHQKRKLQLATVFRSVTQMLMTKTDTETVNSTRNYGENIVGCSEMDRTKAKRIRAQTKIMNVYDIKF